MNRPDLGLREQVRRRYAEAATAVDRTGRCSSETTDDQVGPDAGGCCRSTEQLDFFGTRGYDEDDRSALPADAVAASLGCGNPVAVAELRAGDTVLDLGSGGGIDVLLSARRVGPTGTAHGLDMTDEMLELARRNATAAGATNVEFHKGHIEDIPLPDGSVDVVISNCVINLSTDKPAVFAEMARVLRPGGRVGVSDVVAEDRLSPTDRTARGEYTGCIAGALSFTEYRDGLAAAGFTDITITPTTEVVDGMHSAIVRAVRH